MARKRIALTSKISIKDKLKLSEHDNILITELRTFQLCYEMLLNRLWEASDLAHARLSATIYMRPHLLTSSSKQYVNHLGTYQHVFVWGDESEVNTWMTNEMSDNVTFIIAEPTNPILQEGFLLFQTPQSSRLLLAWMDTADNVQGVLVTNPRSVKNIIYGIDTIIQQNRGGTSETYR